MNDCKKFNETALPEKEEFYSNMNMEDITDADYMHGKEFVKPYHDLYLKSDTLPLADVFKKFGKLFFKIYQLDPAKCLLAPELACQAAFKKREVKLKLLADVDMLLMVEK